MLKKKDIYNYLDKKFAEKHKDLREKYIKESTPIYQAILADEKLVKHLQAIDESLDSFVKHFAQVPGTDFAYKHKQMKFDHMRKSFNARYREEMKYEFVLDTDSASWMRPLHMENNDPLEKAKEKYNEIVKRANKDKDDLRSLKKELDSVIKNETNGNYAKKALIALGVDMSGVAEESSSLPAIQKLSVDPSIINM